MSQTLPRILVGIDFSPSSKRAADEACRLAKQLGADLDFVHICPVPWSAPDVPSGGTMFDDAKQALDAFTQVARAQGFNAKAHFGIGGAAFGLCDFIRQLEPSLVVVGSHGRGAVMRALVGSVAEIIIRRSTVPVLVVPAAARIEATRDAAWSCRDCGHIPTKHESTSRCGQCGASPAHWNTAPISDQPIDAGLPSVADEGRYQIGENNSASLFATSPGGNEGCDINPELRVRY